MQKQDVDIVEKLRIKYDWDLFDFTSLFLLNEEREEAANEIEKLRNEIDRVRRDNISYT